MVSVAAVSTSQTPELRATVRDAAATAAASTATATATIITLLPPVVGERRDSLAPAAAANRRPPSAQPSLRDSSQTTDPAAQNQSETASAPSGQFSTFLAQLLSQQSGTGTGTAIISPRSLQQATATYQAVTDLTVKQQTSAVQVPGLPTSLSSGHIFDLVI